MSCVGLKEHQVNPRKPHNCEWCAEKIPAGEKCMYRAYVWEGVFHSAYQHLECYEAMQKSAIDDNNLEFDEGMFNRGQTYAEWEG
ncbi:hypothetical protein [Aliikangiella coralliicola]|uniref:Uncharacterized protein n=1 Tax=Aliikangiella coralliicola TaxID=2592383 RepID=A0A545U089_9GAMM|nr:hypothetical protein [Aliikangiella coralliicola]TQV82880.1 hypothetical protein FLL46_24225 [Aliikangiella coralliicola]